jgi:type VI secretion system VasD/TssJ family lipoprotein
MMKRRFFFLCLIIMCVACVSGCSKPRINIVAASLPNVNPDYSGRPSPVIVKMYELQRDIAFKQADFQTLFEKPMQALGADLIAADELVLTPGEVRKVTYQPGTSTRFVGLVAGFRHMERAQWRAIQRINPEEQNLVAIELRDATLMLIPESDSDSWKPEEVIKEYQQRLVSPTPQTSPQTPVKEPSAGNAPKTSSENGLPPNAEGSDEKPSADTHGISQPYKPQIPSMKPVQSQ